MRGDLTNFISIISKPIPNSNLGASHQGLGLGSRRTQSGGGISCDKVKNLFEYQQCISWSWAECFKNYHTASSRVVHFTKAEFLAKLISTRHDPPPFLDFGCSKTLVVFGSPDLRTLHGHTLSSWERIRGLHELSSRWSSCEAIILSFTPPSGHSQRLRRSMRSPAQIERANDLQPRICMR